MRARVLWWGQGPVMCLVASENSDIWALLPFACWPKCELLHPSRWPEEGGRHSRRQLPTLSFLRSHSGETRQTAVLLQGESQFFLCVHHLLVCWCPTEPGSGSPPQLVNIIELASQHPREGKSTESQPAWSFDCQEADTQRGKHTGGIYLQAHIYIGEDSVKLKEM